jgi:hypothetical protein
MTLWVIAAREPTLQPVFNMIAKRAARICKAHFCHVFQFDGGLPKPHPASLVDPSRSSGLRRPNRPSKWAAPGGWPPGSRARAITLPNSQSLGTARSEVRRDLDDLLKTRCEHPLGGSTGIDAAVIDSGFATDSVYRFAFACWRCALTPQPRMNNLHSFDS